MVTDEANRPAGSSHRGWYLGCLARAELALDVVNKVYSGELRSDDDLRIENNRRGRFVA